MKQAYTNTIRGGGGRPLTIATGSKKGNKKQLPPKCAYGAACTRKGCAYRHPSPGEASYETYHQDPRSQICKPFLAGLCTYGHRCMNRHPAQEEADAVRAKYKERECSYGDECQTEGCLYWHPYEAVEAAAAESAEHEYADITAQVEGLGINDAPTYDDWLAMNCPSPPNMDENIAYNIWHYEGSAMQRTPWEVYCLMYGQSNNSKGNTTALTGGASLNVTSHTWEPTTNNLAAYAVNGIDQQYDEEPKTFEEWKGKGQPYPSWFCSDLDPWYDDEGVRRSLEEVYEVLYGEDAQEKFAQKQLEHHLADVSNDPTPAELAAMEAANDLSLPGNTPVQQSSKVGGWASIAAKPAAPAQQQTTNNGIKANIRSYGGATAAASGRDNRKTVLIPKEVWLPSTANADCFHLYPNPIVRFNAVNKHHKPYLDSVTIPKSFEDSASDAKSGKVTLLDVHFQSGKTIAPVLKRFLPPALKKHAEVWIVTGSGHHVAAGHQKREGGGVLFNSVKRYLEEHEEEMAIEFRIGKDTSGGKNKSSGGAFVVRKRL